MVAAESDQAPCSTVARAEGGECIYTCPESQAKVPPAASTTAQSSTSDVLAAAREECIARTNTMRAKLGINWPGTSRPHYLLRDAPAHDECADKAADAAKESLSATEAAIQCNAPVQNLCKGHRGTALEIVGPCIDEFFAEGPGEGPSHERFNNATTTRYPVMSCGFAELPDGTMAMVQDFSDPT
jgi:hypothetical protein